ncbi:MAG: 3-oxoacid CoA-transferase subunit B [Clostridia bacterium]|nr:3-oxoacid CoA-transferase subunit B [Clostridia bacterium]
MDAKELIARRVTKELHDNMIVNLGIGIPTLVANYIPDNIHVLMHSENGIIGISESPKAGEEDKDIYNAGNDLVTAVDEAYFCDSAASFAFVRRGMIDLTVLGALQVDEKGSLASWAIPNKWMPGMGGAMDMVSGAKCVIVAMQHTNKGMPKILKQCTYPLTGKGVVNMIITDMGVMKVTDDGLLLTELAPDITVEQVQSATEAHLIIADNIGCMI